ncbi:hypothetical protein HRbin37_02164 [bacterium HR37]|nr:hypothetical protein HRbin37_02164 [bacterium HR37]
MVGSNSCWKTAVVVDIHTGAGKQLKGILKPLLEAMVYVNSLYHACSVSSCPAALENIIFQRILERLRASGMLLPDKDRVCFENRLKTLSQGIYDVLSIPLMQNGEELLEFILGKVFSPEKGNRSYYFGALGVVNSSFNTVLGLYDKKIPIFLDNLPVSDDIIRGSSVADKVPVIKCLDVISLAGEFSGRNKPICVFFSEGNPGSLYALSRVTVFVNLFVKRFQVISRRIAEKYLLEYEIIKDLEESLVARALLLWLRGHDIGHFFGTDTFCDKGVCESDRIYLILHELKSDMVALYNMRYLSDDLLKDELLYGAYVVSVSEMFRYIRRGGFYNYADSASAFLAYNYFKENGSIVYDPRKNKFRINFNRFEKDIATLLSYVLGVFAEGDLKEATGFVNRWGDIRLPRFSEELSVVFEDREIPHYIDFNFVTVDKVAFL